MSSRTCEAILRDHDGRVWSLCMTSQGNLASGGGGGDNKIRSWEYVVCICVVMNCLFL